MSGVCPTEGCVYAGGHNGPCWSPKSGDPAWSRDLQCRVTIETAGPRCSVRSAFGALLNVDAVNLAPFAAASAPLTRISELLTTAARQANDSERADTELYHRHLITLAVENVVRAVELLANRRVAEELTKQKEGGTK